MSDKNAIQEKEVLDIAWKYFQQHSQQRISYFNFFVVFSGVMTTALLTTFQEKFEAHIVGLGIGIIQSLIAFTFWKIDERNKFLTKLAEDTIKEIESRYSFDDDDLCVEKIKLFSREELLTSELKECQKSKVFFLRQFSHSKSYRLFFVAFFIAGLIGAGSSIFYHSIAKRNISTMKNQNTPIIIVKDSDKFGEINKRLDEIKLQINDLKNRIEENECKIKQNANIP